MVQLAIEPFPDFYLSRMEIESEQTSYTYLTLSKLKDSYPDTQFYFIMGADSLDYFEDWMHPEIICQKAIVLVAVREHWQQKDIAEKIKMIQGLFDAEIYPLSCPKYDAASSNIRQHLKPEKVPEHLLPEPVLTFIREHHLYEE